MNGNFIAGGNQIATSTTGLLQNIAVAIIFVVIVSAMWRAKGAIAGMVSALVCGALAYYIVKLGGITDFATVIKNTFRAYFK